ncbi:AAA family ATPase [Companilactobacillus sp.]|uniref:AAA family ATPase n=1 Tax=Companilactobacillus sp. TaxID=2767905 RepID=UPI0025BF28CD|nr:SMC family ATPase [Companilactobacillus sp.]MCH4009761.1 SMC family ATPase [Companilactobacillus sp.]MCH4052563.1 SMC family ATPase [Companilactobacillus sp.]MCH4077703.1 SMC family ATPase [Companilactobacillus sp.]MCH4126279.1 SMC family ATPase [Companilactobacillus sp.]MCI1311987.1 SMC family ATPase [Companilactobacillus sp.]
MKPVYLQMHYFGPHEDSVIDFRELEEAPIFLIGGDTGAGKSTIFDAMTYALFGTTTGDRNAKELRSQFAPADEKTSVTFYFEQGNQLYRIIRTPEQFLAKKRGTGTTKNTATAKLAIVDEVGGTEISSIATKPVDVANEVDSILNLTADQFKKIILLPQNDFSEFLKSNTNDKEPILKKIFGTQLFTKFTQELKDKYDSARKKNESFDTDLKIQLESTAWTDEEKAALAKEATTQKVVLLKQYVGERETNLASLNKQKTVVDAAVASTDKDFQAGKDLEKKFTDLAKFKTDYQTNIIEKEDEYQKQQAHLSELRWAQLLQDTIRDLDNKTNEYSQNLKQQTELTDKVSIAEQSFSKSKSQVDELTKQTADFEKQNKRSQELAGLIPKVENLESIKQKLALGKPQLVEFQKQFDQQNVVVKELASQIDQKKQTQVSGEALNRTRNSLTVHRQLFVETLSPLENETKNAHQQLAQTQDKVAQLQARFKTTQADVKKAQTIYGQQITRRQDLMIAQLQKELVDGQPCVVCGATDHSNMVHTIDADETELKKAMDEVDQAQNNLASATKAFETVSADLKTAKADLQKLTQEVQVADKNLADKYQELSGDIEFDLPKTFSMEKIKLAFDKQIKNVDDQMAAGNQTAKEIADLETQLKTSNDKVNQLNLQLTAKKTELDNLQSDLEQQDVATDNTSAELTAEKSKLEQSYQKFQTDLQTAQKNMQDANLILSQSKTSLKDLSEQLAKQHKTIKQLTERSTEALEAADAKTNDEAILRSWIDEINHDALSQLQVAISNYQQNKTRLDKEIKQLQTDLKDTEKPDMDKLQTALNQANEQKEAIISKVTYAKKVLDDAKQSFQAVKKIIKSQGTFAKKFGEITSLYNIVTGKDGNDSKLKLETYVVQNYLQRVLNYANDHFINLLSNNRYTFELSDEASDKRTDHGLDINVFDNETGRSRSSNTLSGGETFIAALSIALSLSEVVQSSSDGVKIDALFVDEGFGSLDHETLDKAMEALETIGENRMVGVISHIDSMKNTIGQQVYIKKLGDGRSTVQMISK